MLDERGRTICSGVSAPSAPRMLPPNRHLWCLRCCRTGAIMPRTTQQPLLKNVQACAFRCQASSLYRADCMWCRARKPRQRQALPESRRYRGFCDDRVAVPVERRARSEHERAADHDGARLAAHPRASDRHEGRLRRGRLRRLHHRARPATSTGRCNIQAVNSCLMMLPQIDSCAVLTVEGLAEPDGALHPVQQALVDADATQCGFCTPGFVMAMFAFHHGGEPAEDALIHEALAGNLCRCTGYRSIVDACRAHRAAAGRSLRRRGAGDRRCALPRLPACTDYRHGAQIFLHAAHRSMSCSRRWQQHPGRDSARRRHRSRAARQQGSRVAARRDLDRGGPRTCAGSRPCTARSSSAARSPIPKPCPTSTGIFRPSARSSAASARGRSAISAPSPAISRPRPRSATRCPA